MGALATPTDEGGPRLVISDAAGMSGRSSLVPPDPGPFQATRHSFRLRL